MQYVSVFALLTSLASLFFSLRHNRFNNRFKIYEARVEILSIISESLLIHSRCAAAHRDLVDETRKFDDPQINETAGEIDQLIKLMTSKLDTLFSSASDLADSEIVSRYRDLLPDARRMRDQSVELLEAIARTQTRTAKAANKITKT